MKNCTIYNVEVTSYMIRKRLTDLACQEIISNFLHSLSSSNPKQAYFSWLPFAFSCESATEEFVVWTYWDFYALQYRTCECVGFKKLAIYNHGCDENRKKKLSLYNCEIVIMIIITRMRKIVTSYNIAYKSKNLGEFSHFIFLINSKKQNSSLSILLFYSLLSKY